MKNNANEINIASISSFEKLFVNDTPLTESQKNLIKKSFIPLLLNEHSLTEWRSLLRRNGVTKRQSERYIYDWYGIVII